MKSCEVQREHCVATARSSEVKLRHGHGEGAILLRFSPREFPALSDEEKQAEPLAESQLAPEGQAAFPSITVQHRSLDAPEPIRLKPRRMPVASTSCWSFAAVAGLCGLTKVGFGACAAGCLAGAAQLGHSAVRTVIDSIGHGNARRWQSAVVAPQPAQTPAASSGAVQGLSSSDSGTLPKESPKETPTEKGSDDTAECTGTTGTTLPGHGTAVVPQPAQTPAASSGALQGLSSSDSGTLPKESPKETPTEKGSDDTAECTGTTGTTLPGHGTVLELPSEAVERLSPYLCDYLLRAVTSNQKSSWRRALWRLLGRRWLLSAVHSAMKDPLPLVLALDLDPWEVKLDGYSFNLKMPSMRFAVVLQVEVSSIGCSFVRAFAAFPDELVVNLVRCLQEQMQGWDLREMDPRFAGFTQPARVGFDLEVDWPSSSEIRHRLRLHSPVVCVPQLGDEFGSFGVLSGDADAADAFQASKPKALRNRICQVNLPAVPNALCLVMRDDKTLRFLKYVSRDAPSSRADVSASYRVDAEDSEGSPEGSPD
ncbi:unnamed protein product [Cladocopium goreaui]|uniref:Prolyl 3,4-dihydroxylase ofd1 n=1 Tax=Cladocopium goreaui TaxID=2562237 RepID=A0A9P1C3W2_9DINO|nr:unnamed protein product [Cladocopium goreaui]